MNRAAGVKFLYINTFVFSLSKVIMPYYVLYFLDIGLSFFQIAIIGTVRSIIALIFEVPTGAIADIFGRKSSVILGYLLTAISYALIPSTDVFYFILIIFAFNALFETLFNGAHDAWAIDLVGEDSTEKYFLKSRSIRNIAMIASPVIAALIVGCYGMRVLWVIFAAGICISTLILFFVDDIRAKDNENDEDEEEGFIKHTKQSLMFTAKNSYLLIFFIAIFVFYSVDELTSLAFVPYLEQVGISLPMIGYIFSFIGIIGVFIPLFVERVIKRKSIIFLITVTTVFYGLILIVAGSVSHLLFLVALFIIFTSLDDIFLPLEMSLTNKYIERKNRATVLSLKSMVESVASIIGGPIAGIILAVISIKNALFVSGIFMLAIPVLYLYIYKIKKSKW